MIEDWYIEDEQELSPDDLLEQERRLKDPNQSVLDSQPKLPEDNDPPDTSPTGDDTDTQ